MTSAQPSEESQKQSYWSSLETTFLGHFAPVRMNENKNGKCLLELQHRVSWKHTKHWHKLDLTLTRCSSLPSVSVSVRTLFGVSGIRNLHDCWENLLPVYPANVHKRWVLFTFTVCSSARFTFWRKSSKLADHSEVLITTTEKTRNALVAYKSCPNEEDLRVVRAACGKMQSDAPIATGSGFAPKYKYMPSSACPCWRSLTMNTLESQSEENSGTWDKMWAHYLTSSSANMNWRLSMTLCT